MSVFLSGSATYNTNTGVYQLTVNSNDAGSIRTSQNASIEYVSQYKFFTPASSNTPFNYLLHIGDDSSNIKYLVNGSNFGIMINNTINALNITNIKPYITYGASNLLATKVTDRAIYVRLNDTALARVDTSNMPKDFVSASYISIASSNPTTGNTSIFPHQVQEVLFQATPTFENQVSFKQSVKVPTVYTDEVLSTSNVSTSNLFAYNYSNLPILDSVTSTSVTQLATPNAVKNAYDKATTTSNSLMLLSNSHVSLSNAFYNTTTGAVSTWASNVAWYGSNTASFASNVSVWSSNAGQWSSNTAYNLSNAFYTSSAGASYADAVYGSNTAFWSSNNSLRNTGIANLNGSLYIDGSNGNWVGYSIANKKEYIRFGSTDGPGGSDFARIYSEGANNEGKLVIAIQDDLSSTEAFIVRGEAFNGGTKDHLYIRNDGLVGIGTNNPTSTLDVNGTMNATAITSPTITTINNTLAWASNNLVIKGNSTTTVLNADKILMPATANIIGSGWDYSNDWVARGPTGGYVLRNNGGGLEMYTGKSNEFGMRVTISSNGNTGLGTYFPSERLEVAGAVKVTGNGNAIGITLSNNNSPGIEVTNGTTSLNMGIASGPGGYSGDANINDATIRNNNGKLLLQSGIGSSALCINTQNYVGIGTKLPVAPLDVRGDTYIRGAGGARSKNGVLSVQDSNMSREIRLTATSNNDSYIEFYPDLYFKRIGGGTINSLPILYVGSNGNIGIGTSNNKARLSMTGYEGVYEYGPHLEAFTYADNYPVFQQLNYSHNNISLNFDSYYDGAWKTSTTTNCYQIEKTSGKLNFNCVPTGAGVPAGTNIGWINAMCINENGCVGIGTQSQGFTKLYVNGNCTTSGYSTFKAGSSASAGVNTHFPYTDGKNYIRGTTILADTSTNEKVGIATSTPGYTLDVNGVTRTNKLMIGNDALTAQIGLIRLADILIGPSPARKLEFTLTGSYPNDYMLFLTPLSASGTYDDNFSVTVMKKTSTEIVLSIYRTDANSGWGQNLIIQSLMIAG